MEFFWAFLHDSAFTLQPFFIDGVRLPRVPQEGDTLLLITKSPEIPGTHSLGRPRKDERLSRPWSYPVVLNTELLDWESRTLTTRPLH